MSSLFSYACSFSHLQCLHSYRFATFFFFGISAISWMLPQEKVLFYAGDVEPEA